MTPGPRGVFRHVLSLAMVLALAGCFKSAAPLIDTAHAKYPFTAISLKDDEGQIVALKREGDIYRFIEQGQPPPQVPSAYLLHEIGENAYVIQEASDSGEATYIFAKRDGDSVIIRPVCRGLAPDLLQKLKVEAREEAQSYVFDCYVKDLDGLVGMGTSPTIWSDATKTLKIISIE
ncbi:MULTISPECIES: hypothetical protein [Rhodomicrobium]|uniref:hypothetical protein n=1 Tax=Rhodomicrobium TaxID=1068 RepID=UPI000F73A6B7|nr:MULTISPECIES: hypothetical protein [Rhodomicrobium]